MEDLDLLLKGRDQFNLELVGLSENEVAGKPRESIAFVAANRASEKTEGLTYEEMMVYRQGISLAAETWIASQWLSVKD